MSDRPTVDRRRFLAGLAGLGLAALAAGGTIFAMRGSRRPAGLATARVLLADWDGAVDVGAAYLAARPDEADAERLAALLELPEELPPADGPERAAALAALGESLGSRHRADFREDRVFALGGWTLSLTELRLAAIASLSAGEH
jgi:hypothetical protein